MPDKSPLMPDLFQFTHEELVLSNPELNNKLIPAHVRSAVTTTASSATALPASRTEAIAPPNTSQPTET